MKSSVKLKTQITKDQLRRKEKTTKMKRKKIRKSIPKQKTNTKKDKKGGGTGS